MAFARITTHGVVCLLFALFGISSWVTTNCVWTEINIFQRDLPEKYDMAAYLTVCIASANIFVVAYSIAVKFSRTPPLHYMAAALLFILVVCTSVLIGIWRTTAIIGGKEHSVGLLLGMFFAGGIDCMTSVVYWPYVAQYPAHFSAALSAGESLSSSLSGVVGIIQNVQQAEKHQERFSPEVYFVIFTIIVIISAIAFGCIHMFFPHYLPIFGSGSAPEPLTDEEDNSISNTQVQKQSVNTPPGSPKDYSPLLGFGGLSSVVSNNDNTVTSDSGASGFTKHIPTFGLSQLTVWYLCQIFLLNAIQNGILASLSYYTFRSFKDATYFQGLSINIGAIVTPIIAALPGLIPLKYTSVLAVAWLGLTSYIVAVSISQKPTISVMAHGGVLMLLIVLANALLIAYSKANLFVLIKKGLPMKKHKQAFTYAGYTTQAGSCVAAWVMFVLVVILKVAG